MIEVQEQRIKEVIDYLADSPDGVDLLLEVSIKLGIDPETISNISMGMGMDAIHFITRILMVGDATESSQRAALPATLGSIWMSGFFVGYIVGTGKSAKEVMET